jgi:hypothetical protein
MTSLIWTSTTFSDRTVYLAVNGRKGVYEMRAARAPDGDLIVTTYLNDKPISVGHIGYQDAADFAQSNDNGDFDADHFDGSRGEHAHGMPMVPSDVETFHSPREE